MGGVEYAEYLIGEGLANFIDIAEIQYHMMKSFKAHGWPRGLELEASFSPSCAASLTGMMVDHACKVCGKMDRKAITTVDIVEKAP